MTPLNQIFQSPDNDGERYAEDVAALVHFSDYIAKEARRLGLRTAADKARIVQSELLSALQHNQLERLLQNTH